jgi:hypothetical protein
MATKRQILVTAMACSLATEHQTNNGVIRSNAIEDRFKTGWASEAEMTYWNGLSHQGQLRFMTDAMREYRETVEKWNRIDAQMAEWAAEWDAKELAESALGTVHSYEAEAVDEILAEETAENLRVILDNAEKIAEHDKWAAEIDQGDTVALIDSLAAPVEQFVLRTDMTVIDLEGTKCVVWKIGKQETMTMFLSYQPIGGYWLPSAGNVFNKSSGILWKMENRNWWKFEGATWDEAFNLAIDEYNGWNRESKAL